MGWVMYWKSCNPVSGPTSDVANFLVKLYVEGYQASSLNIFRSAISSAHDQVDGMTIGKHPLLCLELKGAFQATCRPPLPCYTAAWNEQTVLKYLESIVLSKYFPITWVSHLQACNAAGNNYTFSFCRPSSIATRFSPKEVVFLPATLAKQSRQRKSLEEFFFILFSTQFIGLDNWGFDCPIQT